MYITKQTVVCKIILFTLIYTRSTNGPLLKVYSRSKGLGNKLLSSRQLQQIEVCFVRRM